MGDPLQTLDKSFSFLANIELEIEQHIGEDEPAAPEVEPQSLTVKPKDRVPVDTSARAKQILDAAAAEECSVAEEEWGTVEELCETAFGEVDASLFTPAEGAEAEVGAADGSVGDPANDTPALQQAPDRSVAGEIYWQRSPYDVDSDEPTDAVFAQQEPTSIPLVLELITPVPSTETERLVLEERLGRNDPQPGLPHPTYSRESSRTVITGGDPVDLFSGVLTLSNVDLEVPTAVLPLRLTRLYRSGRGYFGPWGFNWDHNYNVYLRELLEGDVAYWTGTLQERRFHWNGHSFEPERGLLARLARIGEQRYEIVQPGGLALRFERPPGWTDAERIPLGALRDRHGNSQMLTYDERNRLSRVDDDDGRWIGFTYAWHGLLEHISEPSGVEVGYEYDVERRHLVEVDFPPTAAYPSGSDVSYEYSHDAGHPAMRHNIVHVIDADGLTFVQTEYGGPERGLAFNRVIRQLSGDFPYCYEYQQIQYVPPAAAFVKYPATRTLLRPPDGSLHTYTFNYRGDLLDHRFRLNIDRSFRVVASQWEYDEHGNVTAEVHPDGGRTQYTYDAASSNPCARGNLLKIELRAPLPFVTASRVVFLANYDDLFLLPRTIVDERGLETRFSYDFDESPGPGATGRPTRLEFPVVNLPDGSTQAAAIEIETNNRGQVTATVSPEGIRNELHYFPAGGQPSTGSFAGFLSTFIRDAAGIAYTNAYAYDTAGLLKSVSKPLDVVLGFSHNALGQLEETVLPPAPGSAARVRAQFTREGFPIRVERPRGEYADPVITDNAIVDEYRLDVLGNVRELIAGANTAQPRHTTFCRDHRGSAREVVNPMGTRTRRCFDERGLMLEETVGFGTAEALTTRWSYDRGGLLQRVTEPNGAITQVTLRDVWRRPLEIRLPNGALQRLEWEPMDRLGEIRVEEEIGEGTRILERRQFGYDERGRLVRATLHVIEPDATAEKLLTTTYVYSADDRLREIRLPRGGVLTFDYDGLNRLARTEDPFGNVEERVYGTTNNTVTVTRHEVEPGGTRTSSWHYDYDTRDRPVKARVPTGAEVACTYDDRNLVVEYHEPLGVITRFRYGLLGEVLETALDPTGLNIKSNCDYDLLGRSTGFVDPLGETTHWTRDALGRIRTLLLPDGSLWQQTFNGGGQLATQTTPAGSQFLFGYDPQSGELQSIECVPGTGVQGIPKHEFVHDLLGRLVGASFPGHSISREYDSVGRLLTESSNGKSIQLEYDDAAGQIDLVYPDGRRERTILDVGGRPSQLSLVTSGLLGGTPGSVIAQFAYAGRDRLYSIAHGNGILSELAYDDALRLTRVEHRKGGQVLESCRYRYDARDRRRLIQLLGPPETNRLHIFDSRDRLVAALSDFPLAPLADPVTPQEHQDDIAAAEQASAAAQEKDTFLLDAADSRQQRQVTTANSSTSASYTYTAGHQVKQAGSELITYHVEGPRKEDGHYRYDIDAFGRVIQLRESPSGPVRVKFAYDPLSRPAMTEIDGQTYHRWFMGTQWIHEAEAISGSVRQITVHPLWPARLEQRESGSRLTSHLDGTFSSLFVSDDSGAVVERHRFGAFGDVSRFTANGVPIPGGTGGMGPIFGGMDFHETLGLYDTPARLYRPEHGLFISRGPQLYGDSPAPYLYAAHNPVDFVDPRGMDKTAARDFLGDAELLENAVAHLFQGMPLLEGNPFRLPRLSQPGERGFTRGAKNVALGSVSAGLGLWVALTVGSGGTLTIPATLLVIGGVLSFGTGSAQVVMGIGQMATEPSPKQAKAQEKAVNFMTTVGSDPISLGAGVVTLGVTGDPEMTERVALVSGLVGGFYDPKKYGSYLFSQAGPRFRAHNAAHRQFVLSWLQNNPTHPLVPLINPATGNFYSGHWWLANDPIWEAGHVIGKEGVLVYGAPELLQIECKFFNQLSAHLIETPGGIVVNPGRLIRGLAVEERTAFELAMSGRFPLLTPTMVEQAPVVFGQDPRKRFAPVLRLKWKF